MKHRKGQYLLVASQNAGNVLVMKIGVNGALTKVGNPVSAVGGAQAVVVVPVPKI